MFPAEVHIERAELLLQQKRYKDAEREAGIVLQQDPKNVDALQIIGHCKLDTRQIDEAISLFKQCIGIDPEDHYCLYLLAFAYYQKDYYDLAVRYANEAIAMFPYNSGYFALLGYVELEKKNYKKALEAANKGLEMNAEDVSCLNIRSSALFRMNKKEEAYESINEALEIDPEDAHTHTNYGWHHLEKGRHKKAYQHFSQALRVSPNNASAREGYKLALKSKLPFYRWLLQYSFFVESKGRGFRIAFIIGFVLLARLVSALSDYGGIVGIIFGLIAVLYVLFVLLSWLGNSFANLYLAMTRHGRYILTTSEKWSGYMVGIVVLAGVLVFVAAYFFTEKLIPVGLLLCSLAIPFSEMEFPVKPFKGSGRAVTAQLAIGVGLMAVILAFINSELAMLAAIIYLILFVGFMWSGSLFGR